MNRYSWGQMAKSKILTLCLDLFFCQSLPTPALENQLFLFLFLRCAGNHTLIFILFYFVFFLGPYYWHMEIPRLGLNQNCSRWPTPQLQQWWIWAWFSTFTTAHSNARSLTHWERPEIEPASLWMLIRFVSTEQGRELRELHFIFYYYFFFFLNYSNEFITSVVV